MLKKKTESTNRQPSKTEIVIREAFCGTGLHRISGSYLLTIPKGFLEEAGELIEGRYWVQIRLGDEKNTLTVKVLTMKDIKEGLNISVPVGIDIKGR